MEALVKSCNIYWVRSDMPTHAQFSPKKQSANISVPSYFGLSGLFFASSYIFMKDKCYHAVFVWHAQRYLK